MRFLHLTILLAGCTTIDQDQGWLEADHPTARIGLSGGYIAELSASAELSGPIEPGAPYTIAGAAINDLEWNVLDRPELTVGDQVWFGDGPVWAVDTRTLAPASLIAACGHEVSFQFTFGTTMSDGHQESTGTVVDTYVYCL